MKKVETSLSDFAAALLADGLSQDQFDEALLRASAIQEFSERRAEASLRKFTAWWLLGSCTVVLGVSVLLIVMQAFGRTSLPDAAITALVASVPVEFLGVFVIMVRYLFSDSEKR